MAGISRGSPSLLRARQLWRQSAADLRAARRALRAGETLQCGFLALQAAVAALAALAHRRREPQVVMHSLSELLRQCAPAFAAPAPARGLGWRLLERLGAGPPPPLEALGRACQVLEEAQQANPFALREASPTAEELREARQQALARLAACRLVRKAARRALRRGGHFRE